MAKGDISLPNTSGAADPRIARDGELKRQRAFLTREQASPKPAAKRSVASRMVTGYRAITGSR